MLLAAITQGMGAPVAVCISPTMIEGREVTEKKLGCKVRATCWYSSQPALPCRWELWEVVHRSLHIIKMLLSD